MSAARWLNPLLLVALTSVSSGLSQNALAKDASELYVKGDHSASAKSGDPECWGVERWPTAMAFAQLKNDGILDNYTVDFTKTRTTRIASEKIGPNLYRQVHDVEFTQKSGEQVEIITVNDASHEECSMSSVDVFVVLKHLPR